MGYKGAIPAGTTVSVVLTLEDTQGPAPLLAAFAPWEGGEADDDGTIVNPQTSGDVEVSASETGLLSIVVDMSDDLDEGTLQVFVDGEPRTPAPVPIVGDTKWTYSIEATS